MTEPPVRRAISANLAAISHNDRRMARRMWSLVLAGGRGQRLAALTGGIPKQYYAPRGGLTLLEDTLARLAPLIVATRTVTVIDRAHEEIAAALESRASLGHLAHQPLDRGTAVGVLFGLTELPADPDDVVILTPADHGVSSLRTYRLGLRRAANAVAGGRADIVLFAVVPHGPSGDLGWILPDRETLPVPGDLPHVGAFIEKPDADLAQRLFRAGAGWNTMVLVGRVGALFGVCRHHLPTQAAVFERARRLPPAHRRAFLQDAYVDLPAADFSHDVLTPAVGLHLYTWPDTLGWTDLGTPARLAAWLERQAPSSDDREQRRTAHLTRF
jgi:mannose-1-phosphate guanylyltransferase